MSAFFPLQIIKTWTFPLVAAFVQQFLSTDRSLQSSRNRESKEINSLFESDSTIIAIFITYLFIHIYIYVATRFARMYKCGMTVLCGSLVLHVGWAAFLRAVTFLFPGRCTDNKRIRNLEHLTYFLVATTKKILLFKLSDIYIFFKNKL